MMFSAIFVSSFHCSAVKWSQRLYYSSPAPARGRDAGFARKLRLGALLGEGRGLLAAQVFYAQLEHAEGVPLAVYGASLSSGAYLRARRSMARRLAASSVTSRTSPKAMTLRK